MERLV